MPEGSQIESMFAGIAGRYDCANHLLSFGIDALWRRRLVHLVARRDPGSVVDLATGTGDVAFALARRLDPAVRITGMDFCAPMLAIADDKKRPEPRHQRLNFASGDCLALPLSDDSVDALTIAFGLRNLEDRHRGLVEMHRVLRPGGRLFVLEFTQPDRWFRPFYYAYLKTLLPLIAGLATGDRNAYRYLAGSIEAFPTRESLAEEIRAAGFTEVRHEGMTFSTVAIHEARA